MRLRLAQRREGTVEGEVPRAADQEILGREASDDLAPVGGYHDLFLDSRGRPAVGGGPVGLECEDHALLKHLGMVEGDEAAEDRPFPDRQADTVPVLERERGHLVFEPELLRFGPHGADVCGCCAGSHQSDRTVDQLAADLVSIPLGRRRAADLECAVVAGAVAVVAVKDVEERRVAWSDDAIAVDVWVGCTPFSRDGVDTFDVLRAEVVQDFVDKPDALVLANSRTQESVELFRTLRPPSNRRGLRG